jgi:hypothetical protein
MLLYVVCTAGEFFWNEGGVVPATRYAPYITMCDFFRISWFLCHVFKTSANERIDDKIFLAYILTY